MSSKYVSSFEQAIIDKIKEMRIERGISQKDLAYMMNKSSSFVSNIENPTYRAKYNLDHINELAKIFDCSPKDFLPETYL